MNKKLLKIIILQLLFIILCGVVVKNVVQREFLLRDLKIIQEEFVYADNYYKRNRYSEYNFYEIRQSFRHLASSISKYEVVDEMIITPNTAKIIRSMSTKFYIIASSNIISKENAALYYDKLDEIREVIKRAPNDIRFKDISNQTYEKLNKLLKDLEDIHKKEIIKRSTSN